MAEDTMFKYNRKENLIEKYTMDDLKTRMAMNLIDMQTRISAKKEYRPECLELKEFPIKNYTEAKDKVKAFKKLITNFWSNDGIHEYTEIINWKNERNTKISDTNELIITSEVLIEIARIFAYISESLFKSREKYVKDFIETGNYDKVKPLKRSGGIDFEEILDDFGFVKTIKFQVYTGAESENLNESQLKNAALIFAIFFKNFFNQALDLYDDFNILSYKNNITKKNKNLALNERMLSHDISVDSSKFIINFFLFNVAYQTLQIKALGLTLYDSYIPEINKVFSDCFSSDQNEIMSQSTYKIKMPNKDLRGSQMIFKKSTSVQDMDLSIDPTQKLSVQGDLDTFINKSVLEPTEPIKEEPSYKDNLIFFSTVVNSNSPVYILDLEINALDPHLFKAVNNIIVCLESYLSKLSIKFFPPFIFTNYEKTFFNRNYLKPKKEQIENEEEIPLPEQGFNEDQEILAPDFLDKFYLDRESMKMVKKEKVVSKLFKSFNENLEELSFVLIQRMGCLKKIKLDFTDFSGTKYDFENYDNFYCAIFCFLINIFRKMEDNNTNKPELEEFTIKIDDPYERFYYIFLEAKKKFIKDFEELSINKLEAKIFHLYFPNFSSFIPFDKFPLSLKTLVFHNMSHLDLVNLGEFLKNSKGEAFPNLERLKLDFKYMAKPPLEALETLFKYSALKELKECEVLFPFELTEDILIKLIRMFKSAKSIEYPIISYKLRFCLIENHMRDIQKNIKLLRSTKNIFFYCPQKVEKDKPKFLLRLYKLPKERIKKYLTIIYSLNKLGLEFNPKCKRTKQDVLEYIFHLMGGEQSKCTIEFSDFN